MKKIRMVLPGSKKITLRALLITAAIDGESLLFNLYLDDDVRHLLAALLDLNIRLKLDEATHSCVISGDSTFFSRASELTRVGNQELLGGEIEVTPFQSREFVNALFIATPFAETPVLIKVQDRLDYSDIHLTTEMMGEFGVLVKRMHQTRFYIPVPQSYRAREYIIEPDLSLAAFFFARALLTETELHVQPILRENTKQPSVKFLAVLEKMGCTILENETELTLKSCREFSGVSVDLRDFSATFMALCAIAPFATTPMTLTNINEKSSRIIAIKEALEQLNIQIEAGNDWIKIFPSIPKARTVDCKNNPWVAMALTLIALREPKIKIIGAECIQKICPEFLV